MSKGESRSPGSMWLLRKRPFKSLSSQVWLQAVFTLTLLLVGLRETSCTSHQIKDRAPASSERKNTYNNNNALLEQQETNPKRDLKILARVSMLSCSDCFRQKRQVFSDKVEMKLEAPLELLGAPNETYPLSSNNTDGSLVEYILRLQETESFLGNGFKVIARDGNGTTHVISGGESHQEVSTSCLYRGDILGVPEALVAVSLCSGFNSVTGLLMTNTRRFTLEPLSETVAEHRRLKKRHSELGEFREDGSKSKVSQRPQVFVVISQDVPLPKGGGGCGLSFRNRKKMEDIMQGEMEAYESLQPESAKRVKRNLWGETRTHPTPMVIELAVFVDDVMYSSVKTSKPNEDTAITAIKSVVFTYLNAVQLIYNSETLHTRFRFVLKRLEVFTAPPPNLDKAQGDIESYLENFCQWQYSMNPGTSLNSDHWDHGLLLTGLDLYDKTPDAKSVIGLAWVSGMCHPKFSCTINEGSNFESVYVIAHEMGHNLGMNHDGEAQEGNYCDPDKYLMSPLLGPGKVAWSTCSANELEAFLNGKYRSQAMCLRNLAVPEKRFDFGAEGQLPGIKVNSVMQCQQFFDSSFTSYTVPGKPPFENPCRELWCRNASHALRSHPALEGTTCDDTPLPSGSRCRSGQCSPYSVPASIKGLLHLDKLEEAVTGSPPPWYDYLFTQVFQDLKIKVSAEYKKREL